MSQKPVTLLSRQLCSRSRSLGLSRSCFFENQRHFTLSTPRPSSRKGPSRTTPPSPKPPRQTKSSFHTTARAQSHPIDDDMVSKEGKAPKGLVLKTPKGTKDWSGAEMLLRDDIFSGISDVFKRHGGTPLDTPVFELNEILSNKYGEDSKLIYQLEDQGGEITSLRYDLTVPFARWLAMTSTLNIKRYHIAKVYRRDQPSVARGRMREFFQCDFDIAGEYDPMVPDAEILAIIVEVFEALDLAKDISIKINHRKILDGLFAVAGVKDELIRPISSAVDKLDKLSWEEVKKEMLEKGLEEAVADKIGEYVKHSGGANIIELLRADASASANETVKAGLADMELLFRYLGAFGITDKVSFDLSLARGLDYYTGVIYEVVVNLPGGSERDESTRVGSIAAGGRYDNLVGMFGKRQIPCVGISFGVDRIFTILKARQGKGKAAQDAARKVDVYVMAFGGKGFDGFLPERMTIARQLWNGGIRAEYSAKVKPKLPQQFKAAEAGNVPLAVILGEGELAEGKVRVKQLGLGDAASAEGKEGKLVAKEDLVSEIKKALQAEGGEELAIRPKTVAAE